MTQLDPTHQHIVFIVTLLIVRVSRLCKTLFKLVELLKFKPPYRSIKLINLGFINSTFLWLTNAPEVFQTIII